MRSYDLTDEAVEDLRAIARYTIRKWGEAQLRQYQSSLIAAFDAIANGEVVARTFSSDFPAVYVTRHQQHFIFYVQENMPRPLIIAIFHSRQDIVARLADRLE